MTTSNGSSIMNSVKFVNYLFQNETLVHCIGDPTYDGFQRIIPVTVRELLHKFAPSTRKSFSISIDYNDVC